MECIQGFWPSNEEYLREFHRKASERRVPLSGSFNLTDRCNLNCIHCYLGPHNGEQANLQVQGEMKTSQVLSLIDEITEAGCMNLLITGGEPLLRKDFTTIYHHAKTCGLMVTVFTNATLITDEIVQLFADLPPWEVEVTIYGAVASTHDGITRVKGSYERSMEGIERLLKAKVKVGLKTILMTLNRHEFFAMQAKANEMGVDFRFDAALFPKFNGDRAVLDLRVPAKEAIELEFFDKKRAHKLREYFKKVTPPPFSDRLFQCGTGITNFHIDPYGNIHPCLMVRNEKFRYNVLSRGFMKGWREVIPLIREEKASAGNICSRCEKRMLCGLCPPLAELEKGNKEDCSEYLCEMGQLRFQMLTEKLLVGGTSGFQKCA